MTPDSPPPTPFGIDPPAQEPRARFDAVVFPDGEAPHTLEYSVPVRDGIELAVDVHLPAAAKLPAPAIVVGTPYDKSSPLESRVHRDLGDYVVVVYDVRGRGKSEGEWRPRVGAGEDGFDVLARVVDKEWCSGEIGVTGHSFGGYVAWATAAEKPPGLKAIVTTGAVGRLMEEIPYTNGCFWLFYISWWSFCRRRIIDGHTVEVDSLLGTLPVRAAAETIKPAGPGWRDYREHDHLDEYWQAQRFASSDYPWFARNLNHFGPIADQDEPRVATNTVYRGTSHPSCLRLPVEGEA